MIKKQNAFTLAEVLIAMTLIGVVAAMTIPNLLHDTQKKTAGAILGRATEQIQVGCQNMIQFENDEVTDGSYYDKILIANSGFDTKMAGYIGARKITPGTAALKSYDGSSSGENWTGTTAYVFKKFKAEARIKKQSNADADTLESIVARIYIDTNTSEKKPNALGKDVFIYELENSCRMFPVGRDDPSKCPNDGGTNCAARVAANGFKIDY